MYLFRGISPFELRAIRRSGFVISTDSIWKQDSTWESLHRRTFFSQARHQADMFAIGAYINNYGSVGRIVRHYLISRRNLLRAKAYTLEINVAESLIKRDTEFAAKGDDEFYTTQPISAKAIRRIYTHQVWLNEVQEDGTLVVMSLTTDTPFAQALHLPFSQVVQHFDKAAADEMLHVSQCKFLAKRIFYLRMLSNTQYCCIAAYLDGAFIRFE